MRRCGRGGYGGEVAGSIAITAYGTPRRPETRAVPPISTGPCGDPGVARSNHPAPERHRACSRRCRICDPRSGHGGAPAPDWTPRRAMAAQMWIHCNVDERRIVHRRRVSSPALTRIFQRFAKRGRGVDGAPQRGKDSRIRGRSRKSANFSGQAGTPVYGTRICPPDPDTARGPAGRLRTGKLRESCLGARASCGTALRCLTPGPTTPPP